MPRGRKSKVVEEPSFSHSDDAVVSQIDFKTEKWTISKLVGIMSKHSMELEAEIQRGQCWNVRQRSLFIHSIITNY